MNFLLLSFLLVSKAFAGGSIAGNGGDVVVCPPNTNEPAIQMLDYYEYYFIEQQRVQFGDPNENFLTKVNNVLAWLDLYSPFRAALYRSRLAAFFPNTTFVATDLIDIPDSLHFVLPSGCKIQQLAIQEHTAVPIHYTIDQRLWNQMDEISKAGLVLHELIYGEALDYGQVNSINARDFHRFLLLPKTGDPTVELADELKKVGFSDLTVEQILPNGDALKLRNSGSDFGKYCGYKVNGVVVDSCSDPKTNYVVESFSGQGYSGSAQQILSVRDGSGKVLYSVNGSDLGYPFELLAIHDNYVETSDDIYVKNPNFEIWCSGKIYLNKNFSAGDLKAGLITGCDASRNHDILGRIKIGDQWHEFTSYTFASERWPTFNGNIHFTEPVQFSIASKYVIEAQDATVVLSNDSSNACLQYLSAQLLKPIMVTVQGNRCLSATAGSISFDASEINDSKLKMDLAPGCTVDAGPGSVEWSWITFKTTKEQFVEGGIAKEQKIYAVLPEDYSQNPAWYNFNPGASFQLTPDKKAYYGGWGFVKADNQ